MTPFVLIGLSSTDSGAFFGGFRHLGGAEIPALWRCLTGSRSCGKVTANVGVGFPEQPDLLQKEQNFRFFLSVSVR